MASETTGLLAVVSEPGARVTLDEFQDWYNHEHVPLRMNNFPSFVTGARFFAVDSLRPSWLALYDLDSPKALLDPNYTKLRQERSPREAELISRLETLERTVCSLLADSGQSTKKSSLASANPTKKIITHELVVDQSLSIEEWKDDIFQKFRMTDGWLRTRVFIVNMDSMDMSGLSKYLVLHELEDEVNVEQPEFEAIIRSREHVEVAELRRWTLYRSYPGVAQGNI